MGKGRYVSQSFFAKGRIRGRGIQEGKWSKLEEGRLKVRMGG